MTNRTNAAIIIISICLSWTLTAQAGTSFHLQSPKMTERLLTEATLRTKSTTEAETDSIPPIKLTAEDDTSQESELASDIQESHIFNEGEVEVMPEFPVGQSALYSFISSNMHYPIVAIENGIQGKVLVQFVVNQDGSIVDTEILRGVDPSLDKEALRIVSLMPKWKPGLKKGKPVRVRFTVPLIFRLQ